MENSEESEGISSGTQEFDATEVENSNFLQ